MHGKSGVDTNGNVIDKACPCTVINPISPLNAVKFSDQGWGKHMMVHIYDLMYPSYVPPTKPNNFTRLDLPNVPEEDNDFYLKVVNQYDDDMLVYLEVPPARKDETVSGEWYDKWNGWTGPTKTLRGSVVDGNEADGDLWNSRVTIAPNNDPGTVSRPTMRVMGDGLKTGGF
jgi:hypothetical protein